MLDSGDSVGELKSSSGGEADVWAGEPGPISGFGTLRSLMSSPEDFRGGNVWINRWESEWSVRIALIYNWNCEPLPAA